jgi:hypothetical protein
VAANHAKMKIVGEMVKLRQWQAGKELQAQH